MIKMLYSLHKTEHAGGGERLMSRDMEVFGGKERNRAWKTNYAKSLPSDMPYQNCQLDRFSPVNTRKKN